MIVWIYNTSHITTFNFIHVFAGIDENECDVIAREHHFPVLTHAFKPYPYVLERAS